MKEDRAIARIRAVREKISARCGDNTKKLVKHYIKLQEKHKHKILGPTSVLH